jgi:hypothetical protein
MKLAVISSLQRGPKSCVILIASPPSLLAVARPLGRRLHGDEALRLPGLLFMPDALPGQATGPKRLVPLELPYCLGILGKSCHLSYVILFPVLSLTAGIMVANGTPRACQR